MSAPSSAYTTFKLAALNPGVVLRDQQAALKLSEYGANIKSLFYLDALLIVQNGSTIGFIGMVNPLGANYKFHNMNTRKGTLSMRAPNGAAMYSLNDCGLNTLPNCSAVTVQRTAANNIYVSATFYSSYYDGLANGNYGYMYRCYNHTDDHWGDWFSTSHNSISQNSYGSPQGHFTTDPYTQVEVYAYATNSEGTIISPTIYFNSSANDSNTDLNGDYQYMGYAIDQYTAEQQVINGYGSGGYLFQDSNGYWYHSHYNNSGAKIFDQPAEDGWYVKGDRSGVENERHIVGQIEQ